MALKSNDLNHKVPADLTHFWVVTVLSNPVRYKRRYELYKPFKDMCVAAGVNLVTVELAFGDRQFMITDRDNGHHVQVRSFEELWHKENMVNLGIRRVRELDDRADKVAWVDADLRPTRSPRDWFEETWHELQHYKFVQMFEEFIDLDSHHRILGGVSKSFMKTYFDVGMVGPIPNEHCKQYPDLCRQRHPHHRHHKHHAKPDSPSSNSGANRWFGPPGGAWAADIKALEEIGMIPDFCILGSGDWHLACALTSSMSKADPEMINCKYTDKLFEIQTRCDRWIKRDVGVVRGALMHDNHGTKATRYYGTRKQILTLNQYDPNTDIKYDGNGVLMLETHEERQIRIRDEVRHYFRQREEDTPEYKR